MMNGQPQIGADYTDRDFHLPLHSYSTSVFWVNRLHRVVPMAALQRPLMAIPP